LLHSAFCLVLYLDPAIKARIIRVVAGKRLLHASAETALLDPINHFWQSLLSALGTVLMLISCVVGKVDRLTQGHKWLRKEGAGPYGLLIFIPGGVSTWSSQSGRNSKYEHIAWGTDTNGPNLFGFPTICVGFLKSAASSIFTLKSTGRLISAFLPRCIG
jgi:hypothetical protein